VNPNVQIYGHVTWSQIDTSFNGTYDGWKFGPGIKVRMDGGWEIDGRFSHGSYDTGIPGLDATVTSARIGLNKRFDMPKGLFGQ
jgi:hypothetical protein